jgi:predicted ATPase
MLTRLEVRGFKNLCDLEVDFGPFTCVAGENAAGKSNLFDAIEFLSLLADHSLMEAAQQVRSTVEHRAGDARDLFWMRDSADASMVLCAEMIVPAAVDDDFGQPAEATITYLRYELEIGFEPGEGSRRSGRLVLLSESLRHINRGDAPKRLRFPHKAKDWRDQVVVGRRAGTYFISTSGSGDERTVKIHQDGGSRGQPKVASAARAPATVVSTTTQADDPTILSARREMQSWRRLALEPAAMRAPDSFNDLQVIEPNGRHLAAALYRVGHDVGDAEGVYARVATRLASLTGLKVESVAVDEDEARETLTLVVTEKQLRVPARSLSEGTLRFLALCVLLEDPAVVGLICMEEPENGIHPANLPAMVQLMQDLAVDPSVPVGQDNPFRQVIINTHSPGVVQLIPPDDLLFADSRPVEPNQAPSLRLRPIRGTWRNDAESDAGAWVGKADLVEYLTAPPGAQLTLDLDEVVDDE